MTNFFRSFIILALLLSSTPSFAKSETTVQQLKDQLMFKEAELELLEDLYDRAEMEYHAWRHRRERERQGAYLTGGAMLGVALVTLGPVFWGGSRLLLTRVPILNKVPILGRLLRFSSEGGEIVLNKLILRGASGKAAKGRLITFMSGQFVFSSAVGMYVINNIISEDKSEAYVLEEMISHAEYREEEIMFLRDIIRNVSEAPSVEETLDPVIGATSILQNDVLLLSHSALTEIDGHLEQSIRAFKRHHRNKLWHKEGLESLYYAKMLVLEQKIDRVAKQISSVVNQIWPQDD